MAYKDREVEREYMRQYYQKNKEKIKEQTKKYYYKNHDAAMAAQHEYYLAHREAILEQMRVYYHRCKKIEPDRVREDGRRRTSKWREANRDLAIERTRKWQNENQEKIREYKKTHRLQYDIYEHNRRARIKGNGGTFTFKELNEQFERQEGFCYYCGDLLYSSFDKEVHIEHKTPVSRGGPNSIDNIALACADCNRRKHTMTEEEFLSTN